MTQGADWMKGMLAWADKKPSDRIRNRDVQDFNGSIRCGRTCDFVVQWSGCGL
jgi:hypothetical protein